MGKAHKTSVGGQALIEGIVMLGPTKSAMSVRLPNGEIETEEKELNRIKDRVKFLGWPFIRGIVNFIESMVFGYKSLMESADKASSDDDEEELSKFDNWLNDKLGDNLMKVVGVISAALGVVISVFLFIYFPTFIVDVFNKHVFENQMGDWRPLLEGILKIIIFVVYIYLVSLMKDIKRVFKYHGAEHKTIFCYENGEELTVENVKKQKRFHPRCGTSFIFVILIISILLSTLINMFVPGLREIRWAWVLVKILLLPVVMGIGYEFIRYAGKHDNLFTKIVSAPGLWMQRITTKEPDDDIIEVGIAALKAVITDNPEDDSIK